MIKVAITGNIASGKSQVERIILSLGYKVADTDKINHYILLTDNEAIEEIKQEFKEHDVLDDNNNISRTKLGEIVFNNDEKKVKLEEILHKRIKKKVNDFFIDNSNEKIVFVAVPLLFETHQENDFDKIIFVSADEDIRLKRLMERNNYSEKYAKIRIAAQDSELTKISKSDYVIYNNSDLISLRKQVADILTKIQAD